MSTEKNVKMNLTLSQDFYRLLKHESAKDFMKVSTWAKQQLMKVVQNKSDNGVSNYEKGSN